MLLSITLLSITFSSNSYIVGDNIYLTNDKGDNWILKFLGFHYLNKNSLCEVIKAGKEDIINYIDKRDPFSFYDIDFDMSISVISYQNISSIDKQSLLHIRRKNARKNRKRIIDHFLSSTGNENIDLTNENTFKTIMRNITINNIIDDK